jgi:hypothetical protein
MVDKIGDKSKIDFSKFQWLIPLEKDYLINVGELSPELLQIPRGDAQLVLDEIVRLVLDLPRNTSPKVVWSQSDSELLVHSDKTTLDITSGLVTITVTVSCDQHEQVAIPVPFGIGQKTLASGLVMSSFQDLQGPKGILEIWSEAIIAFAWESLLELASTICAQVGRDARGLPLVPGTIGASANRLLIQPVSRFPLVVGV